MKPRRYFPPVWTTGLLLGLAGTGTVFCLGHSGGGTGAPPDKPWEVAGTLLIIPSLVLLAGWVLTGFCRALHDWHTEWISQFPAEKQRQIRNAELAALLVGTAAVGEVIHHERRKGAQHRQQIAHERLVVPGETVNLNPQWTGSTWA